MRTVSILLLLLTRLSIAQEKDQPKIVVGIVIDQMRQDYLYRFFHQFSDGGFKRLLKEGYSFKNAHYNYVPTYTAPGHAAIYTGTTPAYNGIIANNWFSREKGRSVYCVADETVSGVGGADKSGKMSPKNLQVSTITDELRLASNFQSKVVGVSIKDRGSILPAGHNPTGAYWFDSNTGNFMTSTYYLDQLPKWAKSFNRKRLVIKYLNQDWLPLLPMEQYTSSTEDDVAYERAFKGQDKAVFPYSLKGLTESNGLGLIRTTPFGNTIVLDMAMAAIEGEELGMDSFTDFLAVSFSSTDYVGHAFGPNSIELQDTYLRLDLEIKRLLDYLDSKFEQEYLVFVTADHGVVNVPLFLSDNKLSGGYLNVKNTDTFLQEKVQEALGEGEWIIHASNDQLFLNRELINERKLALGDVQEIVKNIALQIPEVTEAYTATELAKRNGTSLVRQLMENGFNTKMSGDVVTRLKAGYIDDGYGKAGTTHGSGYAYDTHIPMLFYGWNIPKGQSVRKVAITDIAPSLSMLLNTSLPNATTGQPLFELF
ncbi:MAG: alkaline phosphatase PafA [Bacteroidota bacterium]